MTTSPGIQIHSAPVPTEEEKHQMTLEALKSIDEGRVYSHKEVSAWLRSLGTANPLPRPHR